LFSAVKRAFGRVDVLVNNAGVIHPMATADQLSLKTWSEVIGVNLTGTFLCARAALPLMDRGAAIVNNASIAARTVFAGESAYCAAKHGVLGFTDTLREELRERGIRVISLIEGATDTDIWNQFWPDAPREKMMRPETVAAAVVNAITLPETCVVEELRITPIGGKL
jgi:NAD(P)-dependent dehydrogenase (short-subunit alcohol dehydrogenase family)